MTEPTETTALLADVYIAAEQYDLKGLKALVMKKFSTTTDVKLRPIDFLNTAEKLYTSIPDSDEAYRVLIVAPINKAVDNKAAKEVLEGRSKRQLRMHGNLNSIAFSWHDNNDLDRMNGSAVKILEYERHAPKRLFDGSRQFAPVVHATLKETYRHCAFQQGLDYFNKMKDIMYASIEWKRHTMFQKSANVVTCKLETMMKIQGGFFNNELNALIQRFRQDYTAVFGTLESKSKKAANSDSRLRNKVERILDEYDRIVRRLAEDPEI
ncbi:MAG: hypothetical protein Q9174_007039 [Haloplaca sp. 1 TL-2023]